MAEDSWVFDSLVCFLKGPVWNVPILTFIENKSLTFETDNSDDGDHKNVHESYKNLVDFMLGSYMEDIGIAPEQFEAACGKASKHIKTTFHQSLFEQVWAADDYEIFKRMMIQKNLELQLQALEILQSRYGIVPQSFVSDGSLPPDEKTIMEQVLKKSMEEHEALQSELDTETRHLERALAESAMEKERLESQHRTEHAKMQRALNLPDPVTIPPASAVKEEPAISDDDLNRRREYLKQQRDRLLALKQKERLKQLKEYEASSPAARPKSSYAANKVMAGSTIDPQTLQVRKALAARLKAEVIGHK